MLTWNLFHGRSRPPAGRDLQPEFTWAIAGWSWDVALLQEVPPWWGPGLGRACSATARTALTSRNPGLGLRRAIASRAPDLLKSNGGGANVILVRGQAVLEHRRRTLRRWPERRVLHAVRTADDRWWGNVHAQGHPQARAQADIRRAAATLLAWGGEEGRLVLGGDFNTPRPVAPGFELLGGHRIDLVLGHGARRVAAERLDAGRLSDHPPVLVEVA